MIVELLSPRGESDNLGGSIYVTPAYTQEAEKSYVAAELDMDSGITTDTTQRMSMSPMSRLIDAAIINKTANSRCWVGQINSSA